MEQKLTEFDIKEIKYVWNIKREVNPNFDPKIDEIVKDLCTHDTEYMRLYGLRAMTNIVERTKEVFTRKPKNENEIAKVNFEMSKIENNYEKLVLELFAKERAKYNNQQEKIELQ